MKLNLKRFLTAVLAMLMCACMLTETALTATASDSIDLNYGIAGAENNETLSPSALFGQLYPSLSLSKEESTYLDGKLCTLTYNSSIPQEAVRTLYHKESGVLDISAPPYVYTAQNGSVVEWVPKQVTIDGRTCPFTEGEDGGFVCHFDGLHYADDFEMSVDFSWSVNLSQSVTDALLLQSQADGAAAEAQLEAYAEELARYQAELEAYERYETYLADKAVFDTYQSLMAQYQIAQQKYEDFVEAKTRYDAEKAAYDQYLRDAEEYRILWEKHKAYSDFMTEYGQQYADYLAYCQQMDRVAEKLAIMEMMIVRDSNGWSLYRDIQGKTVTSVLENQDYLIGIGYTKAEDAGEATEALRVLLKGYVSLRATPYPTIYQKNKALYTYYAEHYEAIKENFIKLYEALYNLYGNGVIIDTIEQEGKGVHFRQFLASLYIACCCLDDTKVLSLDWTPGPHFSQTLASYVEPLHLITDDVQASPAGLTYPAVEVQKIVPPEAVEYPGDAPVRVDPPSTEEPKAVPKPQAPASVEDPGEAPPYAEMPTDKPVRPSLTDAEIAWAAAYGSVDYDARQALRGARVLELESRLTRNVSVDNSFKITFYSYDGKTVCHEQVLRYGERADKIDYSHRPKRENTDQYLYEFAAWTLFNGEVWQGEYVESDLSFVPRYRITVREYTVSWVVDGETLTQRYAYGSTPVYPYLLEKAPTELNTYTFSGWDKELLPVTGDVTYTGFFIPARITHTVTWKYGESKELVQTYGSYETPVFAGELDYVTSTHLYRFLRWNSSVLPVTGDVTYTAVYDAEPFSVDAYGQMTEVVHTETSVIAKVEKSSVYWSNLAQYALDTGRDLLLEKGNVSILLTSDAVAALSLAGCNSVALEERQESLGTSYTVRCYDSFGRPITVDAAATVLVRYSAGGGSVPVCYRAVDGDWSELECTRTGGVARAEFAVSDAILVGKQYDLKYQAVSHCNTLKLPQHAPSGARVDLRAECAYGYRITGATVLCADGTSVAVEDLGFYMPESAVTVTLQVEKICYRVSFVVDGQVVSYREYGLGEKIEAPAAPTLEKNDGYVYTFTGWSKDVTVAIGEEYDMVFEAQFLQGILNTDEQQQLLVDHSITKRLTLFAVLAVLLIAAIVLAIVFRKRLKRLVSAAVQRVKRIRQPKNQ